MNLRHLFTMFFTVVGFSLMAQTFAPPFQSVSRKKPAYITMKDGQEYTVYVKSLKFKKGLIDELKVQPITGKKKVKINPEDIDHLYLAPSGLEKLAQKLDAAYDLTKIRDNELSSEHLDNGYLYMESSEVQVKKKKVQYCMLQLMNPTFSGEVKVYNDPISNETASIGIGGMTLAGGLAKSYYIKKDGEKVARRIKKKEYKKDLEEIFSGCKEVVKKYGDNPKWSEFEQFIFDYSTECE